MLWTSVIISNLVFEIPLIISSGGSDVLSILILILLFATFVPVLISESKLKNKNRLGYGIPAMLFLPIPYFIYDTYTCTGKLCGLGSTLAAYTLGFISIVFAIFFTLAKLSNKWTFKQLLTAIIIEISIVTIIAFKLFILR